MNMNDVLVWIDEMAEKYQIAEEDLATLDEILNGVSEEDMMGDTYAEDIPDEE